jgi:tape measure domain-containing protein
MASLIVKITGEASGFKGSMDQANRALDSVSARADKVSGAISSLGSTMSVGLTAPILALGAGVIKTAADMESLRLGLASVAKGSDTTEAQLKRLKEVAKLPGLGFAEAVQGSVRLQSAGFSAQLAERSLKAFGNAIATVGKGKAELDGVTLALSQIASKGKISAEEINQLAERVPQIRVAMKAAFGTADTEILQKAGIGAEEFVTRVVAQLEKLKQVSGGTKNALENLGGALKESADRIGSKMLPAVNAILPKLESLAGLAGDAVDGFTKLPNEVQNTALALGAVTLAAGPVIKAFEGIRAGLATIQLTAGLAGAAMATLFGAVVIAGIVQTMSAIDQLRAKTKAYYDDLDRRRTGKEDLIAGQENAGLGGVRTRDSFITPEASNAAQKYRIDLAGISAELGIFTAKTKAAEPPVKALGDAHQKAGQKTKEHKQHVIAFKEATAEQAISTEKTHQWLEKYHEAINRGAKIAVAYGSDTADGAIRAARGLDILFQSYRQLSDAPDLGNLNKIDFSKLPKVPDPGLPGPGGFEEFKRGGRNIGPEGMLTREQADAIKDRYKQVGKAGQAAMRQVSTVVTDLSRGIAGIIFEGGKMGDMLQKVAKQAGQAIVRELIEGALTKLSSKLLDVGGIFGKVFGGGTGVIKSAAGGAGSVGGAAGSAAGGIGGAASAASSGLAGIIGAAGSVVSAISGVIGNFQMAGMNKTLDLIEHEVRYSQIHLLNTLNKANEYWPYMKNCWESLIRMEQRGMGVAGGGAVQNNFAGAYFLTDSAFEDFMQKQARWLKAQGL